MLDVTMPVKLTDTQLVMLSAAAQREDLCLTAPDQMKGAILTKISEKLVKDDTYTSIHIEEFEIEIRETKLGKEEFTRDIPNVSPNFSGGCF